MREVCGPRDQYPIPTSHRSLPYCFTPKHHSGPRNTNAQWCINRDEEFLVFNMADVNELEDSDKNLFGICVRQEGKRLRLVHLGTKREQIARFWFESNGSHWHGHPLWPTLTKQKTNRSNQAYCPDSIIDLMKAKEIISFAAARKLKRGDEVSFIKEVEP